MVGYKLSKNDWVTTFFVIFRSVREKLLVTVSFDHPVVMAMIIILVRQTGQRGQTGQTGRTGQTGQTGNLRLAAFAILAMLYFLAFCLSSLAMFNEHCSSWFTRGQLASISGM